MKGILATTNYGKIQGVSEDGCIIFKGVPYAEPPIRDLRWKAPQKPKKWDGVYMADAYPNRSAQDTRKGDAAMSFFDKEFGQDPVSSTPVSEDSLYLNIWVPEGYEGEALPVAFYIHGGAFMGGTGHEKEFRTNAYAKRGIILVTINYRLGIFGFLAHPWLNAEDNVSCGNYGILDQIAALDWVKENIAAFGGDPDNITIFGQSAGCMSVQTLLSVDAAKGKYARAIMQSGAGYPVIVQPDIPLELAYTYGERVVQETGAVSLKELRMIPEDCFYDIQGKMMMEMISDGNMILAFAPVRNGSFRSQTYDEITAAGQTANVPTIIGTNTNDITVTPEEAAAGMSRFQKNCVGWAMEMEKTGHSPAYVYHFVRNLPGDDAGAFHSSELWYMFGTLEKCWRPFTEADYILSDQMLTYWTNFMKTGDPNGEGYAQWASCTSKHPYVKVFDVQS